MNVRAFTADESSRLGPAFRGSYLGVIDKVRLPIPSLVNKTCFGFIFHQSYVNKIPTIITIHKLFFLLI
jgi:hypothetical protein